MPKIVILGPCKHAPYEILLTPNPFDKKLYVEDHEKAYGEACKRFYPAIEQADFILVYAPNGIGEHTQKDIDYAKSKGKHIVVFGEAFSRKGFCGSGSMRKSDKPRCYASFTCQFKAVTKVRRSKNGSGNLWKLKHPIQVCLFGGRCSLQSDPSRKEVKP